MMHVLKTSPTEHRLFLRRAFTSAHLCSIGFKSGLYGGKYKSICLFSAIASIMSLLLWKLALSITITQPFGNSGNRASVNQP
jgi:hypothetical protein